MSSTIPRRVPPRCIACKKPLPPYRIGYGTCAHCARTSAAIRKSEAALAAWRLADKALHE